MIRRLSVQTKRRFEVEIGADRFDGDGRANFNVAPGCSLQVAYFEDGRARPSIITWGRKTARLGKRSPEFDLTGILLDELGADGLPTGHWSNHRCIIPIDGFYVWDDNNSDASREYFTTEDGRNFALFGLWVTIPQTPSTESQTFFAVLHESQSVVHNRAAQEFPITANLGDTLPWLDPRSTIDELAIYINELQSLVFKSWHINRYVTCATNNGHLCNAPYEVRRHRFVGRTRITTNSASSKVKIYWGQHGLSKPSWPELAGRIRSCPKPFEGGRADGNRPR